jgi:F-type H+-transporting ATPase subunit a
MEQEHFHWFKLVPGLEHVPHHVSSGIAVVLLLMLSTLAARLIISGSNMDKALVPSPKLNFIGFFDILVEALFKLTVGLLGKDAKHYLPLVGAVFIFVLANNLFGMIPGFLPATDNVNTTLAIGLFVFVYYNYQGIKHGGLAYLKHFMGPAWYLAWLILPIEIISHVVRPFTLALRLRGNITGDHTVLTVFTEMVPYGVPVAAYILGLMVCFIQAFIFTMLTIVYVSMAKEAAEHH